VPVPSHNGSRASPRCMLAAATNLCILAGMLSMWCPWGAVPSASRSSWHQTERNTEATRVTNAKGHVQAPPHHTTGTIGAPFSRRRGLRALLAGFCVLLLVLGTLLVGHPSTNIVFISVNFLLGFLSREARCGKTCTPTAGVWARSYPSLISHVVFYLSGIDSCRDAEVSTRQHKHIGRTSPS
jgi:hypothetical protein